MTEAPDRFLLVEVSRRRFHAPDCEHLVVILRGVFPRQGEGRGRTGVQVVQLVRLKINTMKPAFSDGLNKCWEK